MLCPCSSSARRRGSVLLEVVLALALFVAAATVITAGINASIESTRRLRFQTHAVNLGLSVMSEIQMGVRPIAAVGPEPFPAPFEEWTYRIEMSQAEMSSADPDALRPVEIIIRHTQENIVYRLTQLFRGSEISTGGTNEVSAPALQSSSLR